MQTEWLDSLAEGVILVQRERVHYLNRAAATFLEVTPNYAVGLPLIGVVRDHRLERVFLEQGKTELETRGRVLQARTAPGVLILGDITELRRAQENARELLAVLSHELRTPVTTIRATLEALHFEMEDAQRRRFLERAEGETERLVRLLNDLTVDVKTPKLRSLDLYEVTIKATSLLRDTFKEHHVKLELEVPSFTVLADADKLLQVLINLLENAAIHGPDNAVIYLSAAQRGQFIQVSVRDEGKPLAPESIETLFEPHSRGTVKTRGTGLGLYIVRSIAQRWGGQAWGNALEKGNEFGFSVPLR